MQYLEIKKDLYWVGALDPDLRIFDIIMQTNFGTTYNSYLLKGSEKSVIFETVKAKYFDNYISKLKEICNPEKIDYIVVNHTEPDHAGSVEMLLKYAKYAKVVGSKNAIEFLREIINHDFDYIIVEHGDTLDLGNKTLKFISAPFLHWPDSIYTYIPEDKTLVTCDSFGSHYSFDDILFSKIPENKLNDYQSALLYYYTAIFSPFKNYVLEAINKIKTFEINLILTGHGPVLDKEPMKIVDQYKVWSQPKEKQNIPSIVIPYVAAYGYTEQIAEEIIKGIKTNGEFNIFKYNLNVDNYNELKSLILSQIDSADGILLGTSTINGDALPIIWDIAISLNPIVHGGKVASAFGSYGWSGEGVPNIISRLDQLRMLVADGFTVRFKPSVTELQSSFEYGKNFGKYVLEKKVPPRIIDDYDNISSINPSGEIKKWRCLVCGEVFEGVLPPKVCPACGVGQELFEAVEEIKNIEIITESEKNIVILGSGAAAISAAENVRLSAPNSNITIITNEIFYPYYRPSLSEALSTEFSEEQLLIKPKKWYIENEIKIIFNKNAKSIDAKKKIIYLENNEVIHYDSLVIATGAKATTPPILGIETKGVFTLRTKEDFIKIKDFSQKSKTCAIVGGGVLGLEIAWELKKAGMTVSVIEREARILPRQLDEESSLFLEEKIKDSNISVYKNHFAKKFISENEALTGVELDTGKIIQCDIAIISAGIKANKEIAGISNIKCNSGIIVDEYMRTSEKDIYACGDCAEFGGSIQGLWATALEQGKTAGINSAGGHVNYIQSIQPVTLAAMNTSIFSIGDIGSDPDKSYQTSSYSDSLNSVCKKLYFVNSLFAGGILLGDVSKSGSLLSASKKNTTMADLTKNIFK